MPLSVKGLVIDLFRRKPAPQIAGLPNVHLLRKDRSDFLICCAVLAQLLVDICVCCFWHYCDQIPDEKQLKEIRDYFALPYSLSVK